MATVSRGRGYAALFESLEMRQKPYLTAVILHRCKTAAIPPRY
ncbi:MAG: hypothetical protein ACJZ87_01260 [Paracoccaceae bacterium]